jgi:hypothetical protein
LGFIPFNPTLQIAVRSEQGKAQVAKVSG